MLMAFFTFVFAFVCNNTLDLLSLNCLLKQEIIMNLRNMCVYVNTNIIICKVYLLMELSFACTKEECQGNG